MRRVLMVSPHFPPDSTAATHRVRLIAPHLAACGWEPTVLTIDPRDYEGRLDPALAASVPAAVRVIRTRAWPARVTRGLGIGDLGLRAFDGLRRTAYRIVRTERFDAVFVTIHPTYPALVGAMLKRSVGLPFVLDYQDPWVGAWGRSVGPASNGRPDLKSRASRLVATRLEPIALRAADAVTAVSRATYEQALARTPAARPLMVDELPIGWDRRDFDVLDRIGRVRPPPGDDADEVVRICYVGTLWPAAIETVRAVFEAAASLRTTDARGARLRFHFVGTSSQRGSEGLPAAIPLAKEFGLEAIVSEWAARVDYFDALQLLRDSSAILLVGSDEPHYTPSKVFSVLCAERPVLAVLHEASTGTDLLRRAARAPTVRLVTFDQAQPVRTRVQAIACELRQLLGSPRYRAEDIDLAALEPMSAPALARRLAGVFDRVVSQKDARH